MFPQIVVYSSAQLSRAKPVGLSAIHKRFMYNQQCIIGFFRLSKTGKGAIRHENEEATLDLLSLRVLSGI